MMMMMTNISISSLIHTSSSLSSSIIIIINQDSEKHAFFKQAQPTRFLGFYWVLGFTGFFRFFYLNEQLTSLLVDLAHQLNFYLYSPVL